MSSDRPADLDLGPSLPRTIVVGLGNPVLGDDGVGWRVLEVVAARLRRGVRDPGGGPELVALSAGGLRLMERLVGYDRAILVDAILAPEQPAGSVIACPLSDLQPFGASHLDSSHDASLLEAIAAGRALGASLPAEILVVGVSVQATDRFGDELTSAVARAVEAAAERVLEAVGPVAARARGRPERHRRHAAEGSPTDPPVRHPSALPPRPTGTDAVRGGALPR